MTSVVLFEMFISYIVVNCLLNVSSGKLQVYTFTV